MRFSILSLLLATALTAAAAKLYQEKRRCSDLEARIETYEQTAALQETTSTDRLEMKVGIFENSLAATPPSVELHDAKGRHNRPQSSQDQERQ